MSRHAHFEMTRKGKPGYHQEPVKPSERPGTPAPSPPPAPPLQPVVPRQPDVDRKTEDDPPPLQT